MCVLIYKLEVEEINLPNFLLEACEAIFILRHNIILFFFM